MTITPEPVLKGFTSNFDAPKEVMSFETDDDAESQTLVQVASVDLETVASSKYSQGFLNSVRSDDDDDDSRFDWHSVKDRRSASSPARMSSPRVDERKLPDISSETFEDDGIAASPPRYKTAPPESSNMLFDCTSVMMSCEPDLVLGALDSIKTLLTYTPALTDSAAVCEQDRPLQPLRSEDAEDIRSEIYSVVSSLDEERPATPVKITVQDVQDVVPGTEMPLGDFDAQRAADQAILDEREAANAAAEMSLAAEVLAANAAAVMPPPMSPPTRGRSSVARNLANRSRSLGRTLLQKGRSLTPARQDRTVEAVLSPPQTPQRTPNWLGGGRRTPSSKSTPSTEASTPPSLQELAPPTLEDAKSRSGLNDTSEDKEQSQKDDAKTKAETDEAPRRKTGGRVRSLLKNLRGKNNSKNSSDEQDEPKSSTRKVRSPTPGRRHKDFQYGDDETVDEEVEYQLALEESVEHQRRIQEKAALQEMQHLAVEEALSQAGDLLQPDDGDVVAADSRDDVPNTHKEDSDDDEHEQVVQDMVDEIVEEPIEQEVDPVQLDQNPQDDKPEDSVCAHSEAVTEVKSNRSQSRVVLEGPPVASIEAHSQQTDEPSNSHTKKTSKSKKLSKVASRMLPKRLRRKADPTPAREVAISELESIDTIEENNTIPTDEEGAETKEEDAVAAPSEESTPTKVEEDPKVEEDSKVEDEKNDMESSPQPAEESLEKTPETPKLAPRVRTSGPVDIDDQSMSGSSEEFDEDDDDEESEDEEDGKPYATEVTLEDYALVNPPPPEPVAPSVAASVASSIDELEEEPKEEETKKTETAKKSRRLAGIGKGFLKNRKKRQQLATPAAAAATPAPKTKNLVAAKSIKSAAARILPRKLRKKEPVPASEETESPVLPVEITNLKAVNSRRHAGEDGTASCSVSGTGSSIDLDEAVSGVLEDGNMVTSDCTMLIVS